MSGLATAATAVQPALSGPGQDILASGTCEHLLSTLPEALQDIDADPPIKHLFVVVQAAPQGLTLAEVSRRRQGPLGEGELACHVLRPLLSALAALHGAGIAHGAVRPYNVLLQLRRHAGGHLGHAQHSGHPCSELGEKPESMLGLTTVIVDFSGGSSRGTPPCTSGDPDSLSWPSQKQRLGGGLSDSRQRSICHSSRFAAAKHPHAQAPSTPTEALSGTSSLSSAAQMHHHNHHQQQAPLSAQDLEGSCLRLLDFSFAEEQLSREVVLWGNGMLVRG